MKKVININFKGRVIPIEETAFEQLQKYIESLRRYFANEEGRDEIINDIEDRIAELFDEDLKKGAICITDASVSNVVAGMGSIEDFEQMDAEGPGTTNGHSSSTSSSSSYSRSEEPRGSLSRNSNDKILGGVCSGIAHYLKIDPTIVRILFALITIGFGTGILIYIIMWLILPARDLAPNVRKRLFRNPDDKVIGGVASGLANYFNIAVWIPRLVFCLPLVFGVLTSIFSSMWFDFEPTFITGGFGGTLFVTYIVLWVVLPMATSATDKLQMRGEKIDVASIKNAVQEEMGGVKEKVSEAGSQIKEGAERMGEEIKVVAQNFSSAAKPIASTVSHSAGNAIGMLFKIFFLFIAGVFAFIALMVLIGLMVAGTIAYPLKDFFFESGQNLALWGTLILFLLVPVVAIFVWVIRKISGSKRRNPYLGYTFGSLWLLGWVSVTFLVAGITRNFRSDSFTESVLPVTQPANSKMIVMATEPPIRNSGTYPWFDGNSDEGFDLTEDSMRYSNIKVRVEKSTDSNYSVKILKYSFGKNRKDAEQRAENILFNSNYKDSVLDLGSGLAISKKDRFRGQKVLVQIKIPVGKKIRIDESVANRFNPFEIRINRSSKYNRYRSDFDVDFDDYFDYDTNVDYIMTEDGLRKLDANGNIIQPKKETDANEDNNDNENKDDSIKEKTPDTDTLRYRYKKPSEEKAPEKNTKQIVEQIKLNNKADILIPITVNAL